MDFFAGENSDIVKIFCLKKIFLLITKTLECLKGYHNKGK